KVSGICQAMASWAVALTARPRPGKPTSNFGWAVAGLKLRPRVSENWTWLSWLVTPTVSGVIGPGWPGAFSRRFSPCGAEDVEERRLDGPDGVLGVEAGAVELGLQGADELGVELVGEVEGVGEAVADERQVGGGQGVDVELLLDLVEVLVEAAGHL